MKIHQHLFFTFVLVFLLGLTQNALAQNVKYNNADEITAITGLLDDKTGCERLETFTGNLFKITALETGNDLLSYEFFLLLASGKKQKIYLTIERQVISNVGTAASADKIVKKFLQKNKKLQIKARACGGGGIMTPEEIRRLN